MRAQFGRTAGTGYARFRVSNDRTSDSISSQERLHGKQDAGGITAGVGNQPGCRQMSIDILEIVSRIDLAGQPAVTRVSGANAADSPRRTAPPDAAKRSPESVANVTASLATS